MDTQLDNIIVDECQYDPIKNVYMAGKIERYCWRHNIVANGKNPSRSLLRNHTFKDDDKPDYFDFIFDGNKFRYVGPFFVASNHGDFHGPTTHGSDRFGDGRNEILERCKRGIDNADFVYCWIDSLDCFGTLFELGYANSKKIPILLTYSSKFYTEVLIKTAKSIYQEKFLRNELWFIETAANLIQIADNPVEGFKTIYDYLSL